MANFDTVDSWFEKGFRIRRQKAARGVDVGARRDRSRSSPSGSPPRRGYASFTSGAKNQNIKSVIKKSPEVLVKLPKGGHSNGLSAIKRRLDYISRNGDIELTNERGETITGKGELKGVYNELKAAQIPQESKKREFLHVVFSMPAGTPKQALKDAVLSLAKEEFSNRRYFIAVHDDTKHTHIHVHVATRDIHREDEPRLSPKKNDIFRWRLSFADKLRENGVDAAASERKHRFNFKKPENFVVRQIRADNPSSSVYNQHRAENKAEARYSNATSKPASAFVGALRPPRVPKVYEALNSVLKSALIENKRPTNPAHNKVENNRLDALKSWSMVADSLDRSGDNELANQVRLLMQDGKSPFVSRDQALFDATKAESDKNHKIDYRLIKT